MYSLICRHLQINPTACRDLSAVANPSRQLGSENAARPQTGLGKLLKSSGSLQKALLGLAFLGIGAMISDGILVPAIEGVVPDLQQGSTTCNNITGTFIMAFQVYKRPPQRHLTACSHSTTMPSKLDGC